MVDDHCILTGPPTTKASTALFPISRTIKASAVAFYCHQAISLQNCSRLCEEVNDCHSFTLYDETHRHHGACYHGIDKDWDLYKEQSAHSGRRVKILVTDLSKQNAGNFTSLFINGRRAFRARYTNGNPETGGLYSPNKTGYSVLAASSPDQTCTQNHN